MADDNLKKKKVIVQQFFEISDEYVVTCERSAYFYLIL